MECLTEEMVDDPWPSTTRSVPYLRIATEPMLYLDCQSSNKDVDNTDDFYTPTLKLSQASDLSGKISIILWFVKSNLTPLPYYLVFLYTIIIIQNLETLQYLPHFLHRRTDTEACWGNGMISIEPLVFGMLIWKCGDLQSACPLVNLCFTMSFFCQLQWCPPTSSNTLFTHERIEDMMVQELESYLSLWFLMRLQPRPNMRDFWLCSPLMHLAVFPKTMPRDGFDALTCSVYSADN